MSGESFAPAKSNSSLGVCVLASSSSGNCTLVSSGDTRILIDTGNLPIRTYILKTLNELQTGYRDIDAIFITHAHADHLNGNTFSISYRNGIPIYMHATVMKRLQREGPERFPFYSRCRRAGLFCLFDLKEIKLSKLRIHPFELPHDSPNTVGFTIRNKCKKLTIATDLGCAPAHVLRSFRDCDIIVIESNHDVEMEKNSTRSKLVIRRNLSDYGHLSNQQARKAVEAALSKSRTFPRHIFLAHISQECNSRQLACSTMKQLFSQSSPAPKVELTYPRKRSPYIEI